MTNNVIMNCFSFKYSVVLFKKTAYQAGPGLETIHRTVRQADEIVPSQAVHANQIHLGSANKGPST